MRRLPNLTEQPELLPRPWSRVLGGVVLGVAVAFYLLAFVHLRADFPNGSPWNDWSKTTDEGWYANGAIHRALTGQWRQPGAFNPAVALPVWPALVDVWFRVVGFGMVQLRVLTLLITGLSLVMLFRLVKGSASALTASFAVALLMANPFFFNFSRLAILEPVMIALLLLALVLAREAACRDRLVLYAALGVTMTALVLTKTTGLTLFPGILFFSWMTGRQQNSPAARTMRGLSVAVLTASVAWFTYYFVVIRRFAQDYQLLFRINQDRVHLARVPYFAWYTPSDGMWIDPLLFPLAIVALLASLVWLRELWRNALFGTAVLLAAGYLVFIGYHTNLQPRYYMVLAPSVMIVPVLTLYDLRMRGRQMPAAILAGVLALGLIVMAARTVLFLLHPQYTYLTAANGIAHTVASEPDANRLVIGNQSDTLSLWNGIPGICAQYSVASPAAVLETYKPGWYVAILGAKPPNKMMRQLEESYFLEPRASFEVFDDPQRHTLVLYRLLPREKSAKPSGSRPLSSREQGSITGRIKIAGAM